MGKQGTMPFGGIIKDNQEARKEVLLSHRELRFKFFTKKNLGCHKTTLTFHSFFWLKIGSIKCTVFTKKRRQDKKNRIIITKQRFSA